jgi:alpha-L-rhamnosidase
MTRKTFLQATGGALLTGPAAIAGVAPSQARRDNGWFAAAKPIWPRGLETEKNILAAFRAVFEAPAGRRATLRIAACSLYRVSLNGQFAGHGPARGPHGWFRVDEWDLSDKLLPGKNLIAIEVAGYNVNSYYLPNQPSFLQAEVISGGMVLASTAGEGARFDAAVLPERVRKVQRYTKQRTFTEAYRAAPGFDAWKNDQAAAFRPAECEVLEAKRCLPRRVPYPEFALRQPTGLVCLGRLRAGRVRDGKALFGVAPDMDGFTEAELEVSPWREMEGMSSMPDPGTGKPLAGPTGLPLSANSYAVLDFGTNLTGFIGAKLTCRKRTRLVLLFDEVLTRGDVDYNRLRCVNTVSYELAEGAYDLETLEPYTLRYLKVAMLEGECDAGPFRLREYVNPNAGAAHFASSDPRLNRLFAAGRETFRQNAVDIFMDCPSRERAGWLCDSYFTARTAADLCGETTVEKNFIENFLLPERFAAIPEGMLPMCYPADHPSGTFIPNWALWFVLQLEEYVARTGDTATRDAARPKVLRLFDYFHALRNSDGLLEKLQSWVFLEWSKANDFVQDVNYPSNMLYAAALDAAGRMYGSKRLTGEAEAIRRVIRAQSFDGTFFVDNAVRKSGRLEVTRNRTEVCQYFAFYFGVASPETHAGLWRLLRDEFGPHRVEKGAYPDIHPANSFIGNMLRMEILSRNGLSRQILDESIAYLLYMAERTGTLWENVSTTASCNHGFASHICHTLYRDVLGVYDLDRVGRKVRVRLADAGLDWCEGEIPVPGGRVSVRWRADGARVVYEAVVPAGYTLDVENRTGKELVREGAA